MPQGMIWQEYNLNMKYSTGDTYCICAFSSVQNKSILLNLSDNDDECIQLILHKTLSIDVYYINSSIAERVVLAGVEQLSDNLH